ncbi:MAG: trigger factor [Rhodospirillaceae bacterium]|nr:trigger factor [Rhodospirillaceae bacterium]
MQVIDKSADGLNREFNVVVPATAIEAKVVSRLNEVGRQVKLPGFRPGKVPMKLLRSRFGNEVRGEILESTINESTQAALTEKALKPALQPKVELVTFEEGKDLEFSVKLEVLPEIQDGADLANLELNRPVTSVTDEELDKAVQDFLKSRRTTETVTETRAAKTGDALVIDFVGSIDGVEFEGGKGSDAHLELGAGQFIPGFEEQLIGAKAGDSKVVNVTFPADYGAKDLAGKAASFKVDVKELKTYVTPELTDAVVKEMGDESVDAFKTRMRGFLQQNYDGASRLRVKRQLLDKLAEGHTFPVPRGMVDVEFDAIWRQMEQVVKNGQLDPEDAGKSEDELKAEYRGIAERRVRLGLLLSDIGQKNNITVAQEDLSKAITQEAFRYPGQEAAVVEFYQRNPQALESLRAPIFEEKVVDFIISKAKVTDQSVSVEELMRDPDEAEEAAADTAKPKKKAKANKSPA